MESLSIIKAKDLKVGMIVVVRQFGERCDYKLTKVQSFPSLSKTYGQEFIHVGTAEWVNGIPKLGANFNLNEEFEVVDGSPVLLPNL